MKVEDTRIFDLVPNVLRSWDIVPDEVSPISANGNHHWRVRRGRDSFVLRMYGRGQTESAIRFELDILQWLRDRGWPVAAAVGDIAVESGLAFVLFPLLSGYSRESETFEQQRCRGRILGELHRELSAVTNVGQRSGWQRTDEAVQPATPRRLGGGDLVLRFTQHLERVADRLRSTGASILPITVVHGDLIAKNLLFEGETLSGVLDFDSVHLDLRAADVACARRSKGDEVVRGYLEAASLDDVELKCLDDLWRASVLRYALQLIDRNTLSAPDNSELEWCLRQIEKTRPFGG
jgi:homoserine kinase type II